MCSIYSSVIILCFSLFRCQSAPHIRTLNLLNPSFWTFSPLGEPQTECTHLPSLGLATSEYHAPTVVWILCLEIHQGSQSNLLAKVCKMHVHLHTFPWLWASLSVTGTVQPFIAPKRSSSVLAGLLIFFFFSVNICVFWNFRKLSLD